MVLCLLVIGEACRSAIERNQPANVPQGATFVRGAKVGWWQQCRMGSTRAIITCAIWNEGGQVLYDVFIPYDDGPLPTPRVEHSARLEVPWSRPDMPSERSHSDSKV
jgi:hypothetical protein